ncbi:MAG TPA: hypothetical protein ACFYD7_13845, partial [Candidatus Wujingus californicus]|uniref:hypothetical protein n=1 Tax=Candidatus Wujingus californicus TaxID=3367618 RepID=UPI0040280C43
MLKHLLILFSIIISQNLILLIFDAYPQSAKNTNHVTEETEINHQKIFHENYKDVYEQFGDNAERLYQLHGAFALEFLKEYKIEGLALLERHAGEMASLYPMLDYRDVFQLFNNPDNNAENLKTFSHEILANFYKTFGNEGIKYITDNPENFFLISEDKEKGHVLIQLANEKGDIVFPLTRK